MEIYFCDKQCIFEVTTGRDQFVDLTSLKRVTKFGLDHFIDIEVSDSDSPIICMFK